MSYESYKSFYLLKDQIAGGVDTPLLSHEQTNPNILYLVLPLSLLA
jgi:hypothetical protein